MLFDVTDETNISHFFALRYRRFFLEEDGVSAVDSVADTLCKSPELVGKGFSPNLFFVAPYEVAVLLDLTVDRVTKNKFGGNTSPTSSGDLHKVSATKLTALTPYSLKKNVRY